MIDVCDLPEYLWGSGDRIVEAELDGASLEDQESRLIVQALRNAGGNQSARLLRIGRDALTLQGEEVRSAGMRLLGMGQAILLASRLSGRLHFSRILLHVERKPI